MKWYHIYFLTLKAIVLLHVVLSILGHKKLADMHIFLYADTLLKVTLGLFLAFFFWPSPPKTISWDDGLLVSIGGVLLLIEIKFGPIVKLYSLQKDAIGYLGSPLKKEEQEEQSTP